MLIDHLRLTKQNRLKFDPMQNILAYQSFLSQSAKVILWELNIRHFMKYQTYFFEKIMFATFTSNL